LFFGAEKNPLPSKIVAGYWLLKVPQTPFKHQRLLNVSDVILHRLKVFAVGLFL